MEQHASAIDESSLSKRQKNYKRRPVENFAGIKQVFWAASFSAN
jgi:hypothetical protein